MEDKPKYIITIDPYSNEELDRCGESLGTVGKQNSYYFLKDKVADLDKEVFRKQIEEMSTYYDTKHILEKQSKLNISKEELDEQNKREKDNFVKDNSESLVKKLTNYLTKKRDKIKLIK